MYMGDEDYGRAATLAGEPTLRASRPRGREREREAPALRHARARMQRQPPV